MSISKPSNLEIWNSVCETDPKFTSPAYGGFTSVNGVYLFKRATEIFGIAGIGWGYEILEERYDEGIPFLVKDIGEVTSKTHTLRVKLWFMQDGKRGEVTQYGHTEYIYKTKNGYMVDGEAPKKSLTDGIKKCLSMLGFAGDIFMGQFEDSEYVNELKLKSEIEHADDKDAVKLKQAKEYQEWLAVELRAYALIDGAKALKTVYTGHMRKASRRKDAEGQKLLTETYENRMKEISK